MTVLSLIAKYGGAVYDPSVLSSQWQDSAGTTPAEVGQGVGKMDDLGGGGFHVTQSTSGSRPTLRNSGALYWLEFDAVDDLLAGVASSYSLGATHYLATAVKKYTSNNVTMFQVYQQSTVYSRLQNTSSNNASSIYRTAAGTHSATTASGVFTIGSTKVIDGQQKASYVDVGINGSVTAGTSTSQSGDTVVGAVEIGNGSLGIDFFGGVLLKGEPTATERTFIQNWLAAKAGITL
jgi:hypothetical protein